MPIRITTAAGVEPDHITWLHLTDPRTADADHRRMVGLFPGLHTPVEARCEVSLESRPPTVNRGHPMIRITLSVDVRVGDIRQMGALPLETASPTPQLGVRHVCKPIGNQGEE